MHAKVEQGVHLAEHPVREPIAKTARLTDWDAARVFLDVVRGGSFRAAAEQLAISVNVVRRRIDDFERQLGARLFSRDVHGTRLTKEGELVLAAVEKMEAASFDLMRARTISSQEPAGEVRVVMTEGLGSFWVAPRLGDFQRAFPKIVVELNCTSKPADLLRHEADINVSLTPPTSLALKQVKVGRMHMMLFASRRYIETHGAPRTYDDLASHRIVLQCAAGSVASETFAHWFPRLPQDDLLVMRTNVSSANYWAVASGVGIGLFPTYAFPLSSKLVPLDIPLHRPFDIWLSYHPDSSRTPRVRRTIDWIMDTFSPAKYPWFRDEFIHPHDLRDKYKGPAFVSLFD